VSIRSRDLVIALLLAAPACHEAPPPAPPAPALDRPAQAIPGDLDIALRFDLDKARRVLGPEVTDGIRLDLVDAKGDPGGAALVARAVARASVMWVAFRPGASAALTDNVLVLRGKFSDVDPLMETRSGFSHPADLGGGVLVYERPRPARRSAPARIYAFGEDRLLFVSEAEVDSVERVVEAHRGGEGARPDESGICSFAARPAPLAQLFAADFPAVAEAIVGAVSLHGALDLGDGGLRGSIEASFRTAGEAKTATDRASALLGALAQTKGILGRLANGARAEALGTGVVIRIALDPAATGAALECMQGTAPC